MAPLGVEVTVDEGQEFSIGVASRKEDHSMDELLLDGASPGTGLRVPMAIFSALMAKVLERVLSTA